MCIASSEKSRIVDQEKGSKHEISDAGPPLNLTSACWYLYIVDVVTIFESQTGMIGIT